MDVVEATWEKRNLGVDTMEVSLSDEDLRLGERELMGKIRGIEETYHPGYMVVRIPEGRPTIGLAMAQQGFWKIETQIGLVSERKDMEEAWKRCRRFQRDIHIERAATEADCEEIIRQVQQGMFVTDRIALDPAFGIPVANLRYANWIRDEFERGTTIYFVSVGERRIGFNMEVVKDNRKHGLLGGVFLESQKLGVFLDVAETERNLALGIAEVHFSVSSNNLAVLRLHEQFGFRVDDIVGIYVKHLRFMEESDG